MNSYVMFHCHSEYSLVDSCTKYAEYINLAVENGQKALSISEHGKPLNWTEKLAACKEAGVKYIHSVEIYLTESLEEKVRDNYHTVLMAKNMDGVLELNSLVSKSCDEDHFYYTNRISFDEFLGISDNIISTSACLASPLNKLPDDHPRYMELAEKYDFLEVQPHNCDDQREYNKRLLTLSKKLGKPLIAGTDTHSSSKYKAECRAVLLSSKHKSYGDEDSFDLTYKTYDELVEMFKAQGALPEDEYMTAIENTNLLADMTDELELDTSIKYPILYGSREEDDRRFTALVEEKFEDKLNRGVIPKSQEQAFRDSIKEELRVLRKLEMTGFMLSMSEIVAWCRDSGMAVGTARGSVGGSRVAYITDIIDMNPETWGTLFSRFANENRIEPGDIDTDVVDTDRPAIFQHIIDKFGEEYTARVASFGTIQSKGVIDDVGRHLAMMWEKERFPNGNKEPDWETDHNKNPWSLANIAKIKQEFEADEEKTKKKYPELFYYYDGLIDTKISQSVHPAGIIISPVTLTDRYGVFDKDGERCLFLDMDNAHLAGLIKYDMLILKSVKVIRDCCNYIGIPYPRTHEIDFDDAEVWDDMCRDQSMIFQFESPFAAQSFKRFQPRNIFDMSLVTASIRPSGASYRDTLLQRIQHKNSTDEIDKLLEKNIGYLVYQEDVSKYLMDVCGLSGSEADTVRRGIAKKKLDVLEKMMPKIMEGYCSRSNKPRDAAEKEVTEYLKVIEDASSYMFNYSHSVSYCLLGYYYGYFRHYYPLEFLTSYLNNAANDEDIRNGTAYANRNGIKVTMPKWGISKSDYSYDTEKKIIAKGLSSIKYMSEGIADELYIISHEREYARFVDVLEALSKESSINSRQLEILIKIDFFSDFGNQRELLRIYEMYSDLFKSGEAKKIDKTKIDGTIFEEPVKKYSVGVTKAGGVAKSYTLLDIDSIVKECEDAIKAAGLSDLSDILKIRNFVDVMGYVGYTSGKEEDRRKLYVLDLYPLVRKKDNKQFGYSVITKSIGSGVESRFTVVNNLFDKDPIHKNDIIYCKSFERNGQYFRLTGYDKVYN